LNFDFLSVGAGLTGDNAGILAPTDVGVAAGGAAGWPSLVPVVSATSPGRLVVAGGGMV
jgi:hypothetical protein